MHSIHAERGQDVIIAAIYVKKKKSFGHKGSAGEERKREISGKD